MYICDYNNNRICIYDTSTLSFINKFTSISPQRIKINSDEIYVYTTNKMAVYDISTFTLKRSKTYITGPYNGAVDTTLINFTVIGNKLFFASEYRTLIADKNTLELETQYDTWGKSAFIDTPINAPNVLIDIVFTSDYKMKFYANGMQSNIIQWDASYNFKTSLDLILGNLRSKYSNVKYNWIAFYNKERSLADHNADYLNLSKRFK